MIQLDLHIILYREKKKGKDILRKLPKINKVPKTLIQFKCITKPTKTCLNWLDIG